MDDKGLEGTLGIACLCLLSGAAGSLIGYGWAPPAGAPEPVAHQCPAPPAPPQPSHEPELRDAVASVPPPDADLRALYNEGIDRYVAGDFAGAARRFETVLQVDPGNIEARNALRRTRMELQ